MSFLRAGRIAAARCILAAPARRRMAALVGVEIDSDAPEVGVLTLQRPPVARPSGIAARQNQRRGRRSAIRRFDNRRAPEHARTSEDDVGYPTLRNCGNGLPRAGELAQRSAPHRYRRGHHRARGNTGRQGVRPRDRVRGARVLGGPRPARDVRSPRAYVSDESRRRRGCRVSDESMNRGDAAAAASPRNRGDAAAAAWIFRGDDSRRGWDVDVRSRPARAAGTTARHKS